jgi:3-dehydroquinate synthase
VSEVPSGASAPSERFGTGSPASEASEPARIRVGGESPYDVIVGTGLLGELPGLLGDGVRRVAVIHARALRVTGEAVRDGLAAHGYETHAVDVPDGEQAKDVTVAAHVWSVLGQAAFTRSDAIVGVGGGAATDLAGFVAATWLRGVQVVHVPTTLLGMVDAAVGGKTCATWPPCGRCPRMTTWAGWPRSSRPGSSPTR